MCPYAFIAPLVLLLRITLCGFKIQDFTPIFPIEGKHRLTLEDFSRPLMKIGDY